MLFEKSWTPLKGQPHPVDDLISSVLLEGRLTLDSFSSNSNCMRWLLDNTNHLIYVAVFNKFLPLPVSYTTDVFNAASGMFQEIFEKELKGGKAFKDLSPKLVQEHFAHHFDSLIAKLDKETDFSSSASLSPSLSGSVDSPRPSKSPQGLSHLNCCCFLFPSFLFLM